VKKIWVFVLFLIPIFIGSCDFIPSQQEWVSADPQKAAAAADSVLLSLKNSINGKMYKIADDNILTNKELDSLVQMVNDFRDRKRNYDWNLKALFNLQTSVNLDPEVNTIIGAWTSHYCILRDDGKIIPSLYLGLTGRLVKVEGITVTGLGILLGTVTALMLFFSIISFIGDDEGAAVVFFILAIIFALIIYMF